MAIRDIAMAAAGALGGANPYVEDVFSTYLYTGNGSTQTITNGIDLAGEGGLVWIKNRGDAKSHFLVDTVNGASKYLASNLTSGLTTDTATGVNGFISNGFTLNYGSANPGDRININNSLFSSWTFRKAEKFFDVVTYTGTGSNRTISHNLGSVPGCIIVKRTDTTADWQVYHRSIANTEYMVLNSTAAKATGTTRWNSTTPTSTVFSLGTDSTVNANGGTYVAYLFAHDAGGFGDDGTENVISCGSYTNNGSGNATVNLGWEPQYVILKNASGTSSWLTYDNMRGMPVGTGDKMLGANTTNAEIDLDIIDPTATGFNITSSTPSATYIYIAIRRGPMKVPTDGTTVFSPVATTASANTKITTDFPLDLQIQGFRTAANNSKVMTRMTGVNTSPVDTYSPYLITALSNAETTAAYTRYWDNTGFEISSGLGGGDSVYWNFRRAPGFFDVVCYTGDGNNTARSHNLGVVPELIIVKCRGTAGTNWPVYVAGVTGFTNWLPLNFTNALVPATNKFLGTSSTTFTVGNDSIINGYGSTYVAYLFASCPGVSKVGSYTGTGTTQQINCGFSGGARFVLIKRTDSTGDWYVWDTARGIVAGNDPYLLLNSTAAEVTSIDYVDTYSAGFEISSTAPAAINASGGTFIYLAIA